MRLDYDRIRELEQSEYGEVFTQDRNPVKPLRFWQRPGLWSLTACAAVAVGSLIIRKARQDHPVTCPATPRFVMLSVSTCTRTNGKPRNLGLTARIFLYI